MNVSIRPSGSRPRTSGSITSRWNCRFVVMKNSWTSGFDAVDSSRRRATQTAINADDFLTDEEPQEEEGPKEAVYSLNQAHAKHFLAAGRLL